MTNPSIRLYGISAPRLEWVLFFLCAVLSFALALRADDDLCKFGVQHFGYWQMWLLVGGTAWYGWRVLRVRLGVYRRWWRCCPRWRAVLVLGMISVASLLAHAHFPHRYKVLADEATLMNTSQALVQHRLAFTPGTAAYRNGIFTVSDGFIDKRPYLYPFLVSVVHDMAGYSWRNSIWLNAALTPAIFALFFVLGRRLHRRWGGGGAVLFACGVPIYAQTMTGGGFEPLNLLLLLAATYNGVRLLERPTIDRLGLFVGTVLLLAYTRYESGLYIVAAAPVVWIVMRRSGWGRFPRSLFVAPLFCVPLVWLQIVAFSMEREYFQIGHKNDATAFSASYLPENLRSAWEFFFSFSPVYLGAPLLAWALVLASLWALARLLRGGLVRRVPPVRCAVYCFAAASIANGVVFLFFNYGQYGEYITQRISVPLWGSAIPLLLAFLPERRWLGWGVGVAGALNLLAFALPASTRDLCGTEYFAAKDFQFVADYCAGRPGEEGVMVFSHAPVYWLAMRYPTAGHASAAKDPARMLKPKDMGEFDRILVHVFEYSPNFVVNEPERSRPPVWFPTVRKHLLARRWISAGLWSALYEVDGLADMPSNPGAAAGK